MVDRVVRFVLTGDSAGAVAAMAETGAAADTAGNSLQTVGSKAETAGTKAGGLSSKFKSALEGVGVPAALLNGWAALGVAVVGIGVEGVRAASKYQTSLTTLVTGAGESEKNIKMVGDGMLNMAGQVGTSAQDLSSGMYLIESAGYHGAAGLSVLKAAAEGAKVGGADMATVANAVTTALTDYHLPASQAADVTSALVATVASGKTNMEDLADSVGKVMPVAAALGINMQNVTGAMAAMTNQGLSARFAATHLQNTLLALSAPSSLASKAMGEVGLTSQQVKNTLDGPTSLGGALTLIEQHVGQKFPKGSVQYVTAMKDMLGGTTGYSTALMLSGQNMGAFEQNVSKIGTALGKGSSQVQGFSKVQKDLGFEMASLKADVDSLLIRVGQYLIPILSEAAVWLGKELPTAIRIIGDAFNAVKPFIDSWIQLIKGFITEIQGIVEFIKGVFTGNWSEAWDGIKKIFVGWLSGMGAQISLALGGFGDAFRHFFAQLGDDILSALTGVLDTIFAPFADAGTWIYDNVIQPVVGFFTKLPSNIVSGLGDVASSIWSGFTGAAAWVDTHVVNPVVDSFTALPGHIVAGLGDIVTTIWAGLKTAGTWIDTNVITPVVGYFEGLPKKIVTGLGDIVTTIWAGLKTAASWVDTNVITPVVDYFTALPGKLVTGLGNLFTGFENWGKSVVAAMVRGIGDAGSSIAHELESLIKSGVSKIPVIGGTIAHFFAAGGIVNTPTLAVVGEAGPEAVIPLDNIATGDAGIGSLSGLAGAATGSLSGGAGGSPIGMNVYLQIDGQTFAKATVNDIRQALLVRGRGTINLGLS